MASRALHSRSQRTDLPHRLEWLRDTTVWLAIALCVATVMVLVTETSGAKSHPQATRPLVTSLPRAHLDTKAHASMSKSHASTTTTLAKPTTTTIAHRDQTPASIPLAASRHALTAKTAISPPVVAHEVQSNLPSEATESWTGSASFPSLVASSTSFTTSSGEVHASVTITPASIALQAVLRCGDVSDASTSKSTISVALGASEGPCTLEIHLPSSAFHVGTTANYDVALESPSVASETP